MSALPALAAGCFSDLLLDYEGPYPSHDPIVAERVILRQINPNAVGSSEPGGFWGDRVKYLATGDLSNVNRIVFVGAGSFQPALAALNPREGDTLTISTRYDTTFTAGPSVIIVPPWPGTGKEDYPVAFHTLTAVARP